MNQKRYQDFRESASADDIPSAREIFDNIGWTVSASGCWLWNGTLDPAGYAVFPRHPIAARAHRISYAIHFGMFERLTHIHHKCAVRNCVNPDHLQATTPQENNAEMFERKEYKRQIAALKKEVARLRMELDRLAA